MVPGRDRLRHLTKPVAVAAFRIDVQFCRHAMPLQFKQSVHKILHGYDVVVRVYVEHRRSGGRDTDVVEHPKGRAIDDTCRIAEDGEVRAWRCTIDVVGCVVLAVGKHGCQCRGLPPAENPTIPIR